MALDAFMVIHGDGKKKAPEQRSASVIMKAVKGEFLDAAAAEKQDDAGGFEIVDFDWGAKHTVKSDSDSDEDDDTSGKEKKKKRTRTGHEHYELEIDNITVKKWVDQATPMLFYACCTGCFFDSAKIVFRKQKGGKPFKFFSLLLTDIKIVDWDLKVEETGPQETLKISFGCCYLKYHPQTMEGGKAPAGIMAQWNRGDNTNNTPPMPQQL